MAKIINYIKKNILKERKHILESELITLLSTELNLTTSETKKKLKKLYITQKLWISNNNYVMLPPDKINFNKTINGFTLVQSENKVYLSKNNNNNPFALTADEYSKIELELNNILSEIEVLFLKHNPLELMSYLVSKFTLFPPKNYDGQDFENFGILLETVQKIILKHKLEEYSSTEITYTDLNNLFNLYERFSEILQTYILYFNNEKCLELNSDTLISYLTTRLDYLISRGDAYANHYKEINLELGIYVKETLNPDFNIKSYYSFVELVDNKIYKNLVALKNNSLEISLKCIDQHNIDNTNLKMSNEDTNKLKSEFDNISNIFRIGYLEQNNYLDLLCLSLGDNYDWKNIYSYDRIRIRPLIKVNNSYYCFIPQLLYRNVREIIETQKLPSMEQCFFKLKGTYFENKVLSIFKKLLDVELENCFFKVFDKSGKEIDLLIKKYNYWFIIEIKGKKKRLFKSEIEILNQTKEDVYESIIHTCDQTQKTEEYILNETTPTFFDSNNKKRKLIFTLNKSNIQKIFKIVICADSFNWLTSNIDLMRGIDSEFANKTKDVFVINIYDLLIFRDLIDSTDDFIDYLSQRLELNKTRLLIAGDEIDYLGFFLKEGTLKKAGHVGFISDYSKDIDNYFQNLGNNIISKKPSRTKLNLQ